MEAPRHPLAVLLGAHAVVRTGRPAVLPFYGCIVHRRVAGGALLSAVAQMHLLRPRRA